MKRMKLLALLMIFVFLNTASARIPMTITIDDRSVEFRTAQPFVDENNRWEEHYSMFAEKILSPDELLWPTPQYDEAFFENNFLVRVNWSNGCPCRTSEIVSAAEQNGMLLVIMAGIPKNTDEFGNSLACPAVMTNFFDVFPVDKSLTHLEILLVFAGGED
jgi:hypothetical protein